jgi:hypothetical protein
MVLDCTPEGRGKDGILSWITTREDGLGPFIEPLRKNSGAR